MRYEVATALGCSKIVHIAGGLPCGSWPDKNIAMKGLIQCLNHGEKAAADSGYRDSYKHFLTTFPASGSTPRMKAINKDIKLMGARHETINSKLKKFEALNTRMFHHGRDFHPFVFTAVANLVQLNLEEEPLWSFKDKSVYFTK